MSSVRARPTHIALTRQLLLVAGLEVDLAADRRHPDRVAVVRRCRAPRRRADSASARNRLAEAQRVEDCDRPRPEREDVAQDPADPGRGALERLDGAGVVVRLDLEGDRVAVAEIDRAGVLARTHHDPLTLGRQPAQQLARVLVGAVLGPQQREHRQLDAVGIAPDQLADALVLGVGQPELAVAALQPSRSCRNRRRALEQPQPVDRAGQRVDGVLGMGHQAEHVAGLVRRPRRCRGPTRSGSGPLRSASTTWPLASSSSSRSSGAK